MKKLAYLVGLLTFIQIACGCEASQNEEAAIRSKISKNSNRKMLAWCYPKPGTKWSPDGYPRDVVHCKTGIEMVYISPGSFQMGLSNDDVGSLGAIYHAMIPIRTYSLEDLVRMARPLHHVTLTSGFYLGRFEVTNGQFKKWRPEHNSHRTPLSLTYDAAAKIPEHLDGDNQPAVRLSWEEAAAFCAANDLRLPTEAQWEFAARSGGEGVFPWGADPSQASLYSNMGDSAYMRRLGRSAPPNEVGDGYEETSPVGSFRPNAFGVYDMIGNALEWCADWYDTEYYASSVALLDPTGPSDGVHRVARGGSWQCDILGACPAFRFEALSSIATNEFGFRVARNP